MNGLFRTGVVNLLRRDYKNAKYAAGEILKSVLVLFAAVIAVTVSHDLVHISNHIAEVLFEFVIGGLILQICIGLGCALINCLLDCSSVHFAIEKLLESILEPIVFVGGFFSIYLFFKAAKGTLSAEHAKYSAVGNLIGSSLAVCLASYLCYRITEAQHTSVHLYRPSNQTSFGTEKASLSEVFKSLYDVKNAISSMNVLARVFAEGVARCLEHECTKKFHI